MQTEKSSDILFRSSYGMNFQLTPAEYGLSPLSLDKSEIDLTSYNLVEVYREPLAATSVSLGYLPDSGKRVAIKKIYKEHLITDFQKAQAAQEFPLHCSLNHDNIVKAVEWSENDSEYILVMDYSNRADYFKEKIDVNLTPVKNELKLKFFAHEILTGLAYLHNQGIVHGDIKLENLLVNVDKENDNAYSLKLADFGLSRFLDRGTRKFYMPSVSGSHHYMAPEIRAKAYVDEKIDIWATGIALYKMAVAYKPTQINGYVVGKDPIPFRKVDWRKRSPELQDLIEKLLEADPVKRISAEEALQHPWFHI